MLLEQAKKIFEIYNNDFEYNFTKLGYIFMTQIPESFLPFSKLIIEEAILSLIDFYEKNGDNNSVEFLKGRLVLLSAYVEDKVAFETIGKKISPSWIEIVLPRLKKWHQEFTEDKFRKM